MLMSTKIGECTRYLLFVDPHACFGRRLRACLSCETSLATLCTGHANWTAIRHKDRFMLLCSPLTGAELLFYASWWGLGARASHLGRVYHSWVLCDRSRCLSSLGRAASESETGEMAESKACRLTGGLNHNLNGCVPSTLDDKIIQELKFTFSLDRFDFIWFVESHPSVKMYQDKLNFTRIGKKSTGWNSFINKFYLYFYSHSL